MASSYSTDLKIELMVTGENAGTWGDKTNDNLNVIQQAIAGYGEQSIAGSAQTTALTIANSPTLSVARNIVIKLTGTITGNQIVTVPSGIEKTWIVSNGTTGAFTVEFKTASGTGTTWSTTDKGIKILYSDGTNINAVDITTLSGTVASAQIANLAVTSAKLASFAVTEARLASYAVTTSRLATNAVTAIKIAQSTITQAKLAANSVGSSQLISTGVVAASYVSASITVDADGRITAASSGSGGAGMGVITRYQSGPVSATHTASPNATYLAMYMTAGGGGGGNNAGNPSPAQPGGRGGFGYFAAPVTKPYSAPYVIGAGGSVAGTGGNTNFVLSPNTTWTVNAGTGGSQNTAGTAGNGPGQSPNSTFPQSAFLAGFGVTFGAGGGGAGASPMGSDNYQPNTGSAGQAGALLIFENIGT